MPDGRLANIILFGHRESFVRLIRYPKQAGTDRCLPVRQWVGDNASCVVQIPQPPGMAHHIPAEPRSAFQDHVTGSVLIP